MRAKLSRHPARLRFWHSGHDQDKDLDGALLLACAESYVAQAGHEAVKADRRSGSWYGLVQEAIHEIVVSPAAHHRAHARLRQRTFKDGVRVVIKSASQARVQLRRRFGHAE